MKPFSAVFNRKCDFLAGAQSIDQIPIINNNPPEFAFIGRSNVGKSSLINAVTGVDGLARVSKNPGRTQQINFFSLNGHAILADLPGYGYATVSKKMRKSWDKLILDYLCGRQQLCRAFLLIDSRRGIMQNDEAVMEILDESAVSYQIVLTKIDEIKNIDAAKDSVLKKMEKFIAVYPEIIMTSSKKNVGIRDVQNVVMDFVNR